MRKVLVLTILSFFVTSFVFAAQTDEISHNKPVVEKKSEDFSDTMGNSHYVVNCSGWGFFADRPGNHKPYKNDSDYYTTICSNSSSKGVSITFQQFKLEKFDYLYVWDENRKEPVTKKDTPSSGDFKGKFTGPSSPGTITSRKGCLTFRFVSDDSVVKTGWYGKIGCVNKPTTDPCRTFNRRVDKEIKCGVTYKDDNYRGKNWYEYYGDCTMPGWPSNGRELIFKFVNYKQSDLHIKLKEHNDGQPKRLNMFVLNDCRPDACIGSINRPADNPKQHIDYVDIKNAPAGTYYIVVDGNLPYAHNWFTLRVECAGGDYTTCKDPYYYDDFEAKNRKKKRPRPDVDYYVGDYITKVNPYWFKSDNVGLRDARITDTRSSNGYNSLEFNRAEEGTQDVFLDLGRKFKGVYRICWNMYIEPHHTAFFGLFGGDNSDPWGTVSKEFPHNNGYEGRWFDVELFVDLDRNRYRLYLDNRCKVYSGEYHLNLDKLNFYGLPKAHFYIDHLCYGPVRRIPAIGSISKVANLEETPLFNADKQIQLASNLPVNDDFGDTKNRSISILNADDLKVIPNPTSGTTLIALDLEKEQNINLQIYSSTGQVVKAIPLGKTELIRQEVDLSEFANGLYILRATGETSVITKKIILQR